MGRTSARRWPSTILAVFAVLAGLEGRAAAEPPSSAQRRCLVELDRAGAHVAGLVDAELLRCTRAASRGVLPDGQSFEQCLDADPSGRVRRARSATEIAEARWCDQPPPFGVRNAAWANRMVSTRHKSVALFGAHPGQALGSGAAARDVAACRVAGARAMVQVSKARLREFVDCAEAGLASRKIDSSAALEACVGSDARGRVARATSRASEELADRCGSGIVAEALPGACGSSDAADLGGCLEPQASCDVCLGLNDAERLSAVCHRFADGVATAYCGDRPADDHSAARAWDEALLAAIRIDLPRPVVHARNLFHLSTAMWDAWAAYDGTVDQVLHQERASAADVAEARDTAISFAAYRLVRHRFAASPGAATTSVSLDRLFYALGYDKSFVSTAGDTPAALGNRIAAHVIAWGLDDGSNESTNYADPTYAPLNEPLIVVNPGAGMIDPDRWQPLSLSVQIGQNGVPIPGNVQKNIGSHWYGVRPFALQRSAPDVPYFSLDGPPSFTGPSHAEYVAQAVDVIARQSMLDPTDPTMIDASPGTTGNNPLGSNDGTGHPVNPVTGQPYAPNPVKRQDYFRTLGMYWADGPHSETPPGHWNVLANGVADSPGFERRLGGTGPILDRLEWDVKVYLALNAAVHDAGIAAWEQKRVHDSVRPISMIRFLAGLGQSSDPQGPSYDPLGLPLVPGLIEVITPESSAPGERHAHLAAYVGEIAVRGWRGEPADPTTQVGGIGWIRALKWLAYQRKTFVTPAFPGFTSGHSTFSRAAAEVMTAATGSEFFPGGFAEFVAPADVYLPPEMGPTEPVHVQFATYYDAADQAGISRLWSGIHVPADDAPGRRIGSACGLRAIDLARRYFNGTALP